MNNYPLQTGFEVGLRSNRGEAQTRATRPELSLLRLYTLRIAYLILAAGLGTYVWPIVVHHPSGLVASGGIRLSMLAGLGAMAALGLRYPVQMLPVLLFELCWKAIYLIAFALPLWRSHELTPAIEADVNAVLVVVILLPLIPWRYVFSHYVIERGDRWI